MLLCLCLSITPADTDWSTATPLKLCLDLGVEYQAHRSQEELIIIFKHKDRPPGSTDAPATFQKVDSFLHDQESGIYPMQWKDLFTFHTWCWVGFITGHPGFFLDNLYPYPAKPMPMPTGTGFPFPWMRVSTRSTGLMGSRRFKFHHAFVYSLFILTEQPSYRDNVVTLICWRSMWQQRGMWAWRQ